MVGQKAHEHEHYPATKEDAIELYDDLRDHAGLGHLAAIETVDYETSRQVWGCEDRGPLTAFIVMSEQNLHPIDNPQPEEADAYAVGANIGSAEVTGVRR